MERRVLNIMCVSLIYKESLIFNISDFVYFFVFGATAQGSHGLPIHEVSRPHTTTEHNRYDSSGRVISPSHRPLPDNTQHSQQTDIDRTPLDE